MADFRFWEAGNVRLGMDDCYNANLVSATFTLVGFNQGKALRR